MVDKRQIDAMRKKRDIARAYFDKEGSIHDLAARFHASSSTVQLAIKHDPDWWQAEVEKALAAMQAPREGAVHQHLLITLERGKGPDGGPAYVVSAKEFGVSDRSTLSLPDILDKASQAGWEVVQLLQAEGGGFSGILVRRPVG
jgi:hypothetical protein